MMCGKYRFLLVAAAFYGICLSSSVGAESLREVLSAAMTDHPAVAAASAGHKGAAQEKGVEFSNYFPELSVSATMGRIYQDNATSRGLDVTRGAAYSGYGEGNVALRQMLFDGFETRHRIGAADARMKSQEVSIEDAQEIVALQVASAYIEILRTHAALELLKTQREKISDYESRIKAMVDEGAADEAELQQARDVSMIIDGSIADYEGQILSAHAAYAQATGSTVAEELEVPESSASLLLDDVNEAATLAKAEHPALRVAMLEADAAKQDVDVARAGYFPDLAGELSYAKTDKNDIIGGESVDGRAVVRMNWNFSTGGKQSAAVGQMKYKVAESNARLEEMKRQIERGVFSAYANLQTYRRKVGLSQDRVELNNKLFSAYQAQFEGARISLLGLMKAESQLFNAKLEKMDNDYNLLAAEYGVLASMGRLKSSLLKNGEK